VLGKLKGEKLRAAVGQVDAKLSHDLDYLEMNVLGGRRTRGQRLVPPTGGTLEQGLAHL